MADEKVPVDAEKGDPSPIRPVNRAEAETILKHNVDADEALKAFDGREGETIVIDAETSMAVPFVSRLI